jgi:uncharacterized protein
MLRGEQTPGELKQRSERLHGFADLAAVQRALDGLVEGGYVASHERRPGQKELRYQQLLGGFEEGSVAPTPTADTTESDSEGETTDAPASDGAPSADAAAPDPGLVPAEDRLTRLERELGELRAELGRLREALGEG